MIPINDNKFTPLSNNKDILFFELTNSGDIKAFMPDVQKEDKVILVKILNNKKDNKKDFEVFQKKMLDDNKIVVLVEDI